MSFQSIRTSDQSLGKYRDDLLAYAFTRTGKSVREIAKGAGISRYKLYQALDGDCKKIDTLDRIARTVKLKLKDLFDPDLKESQFHRAVERGST